MDQNYRITRYYHSRYRISPSSCVSAGLCEHVANLQLRSGEFGDVRGNDECTFEGAHQPFLLAILLSEAMLFWASRVPREVQDIDANLKFDLERWKQ